MKAYTDLEQSKKLAEFLPLESADIHWKNGISDNYIQCFTPFVTDDYKSNIDYDYDVPAWSLTALLELMPLINHDTFNVFKEEDGTYTALYRYTKGSPVIIKKESAIDAAFEMVCWLKENKKI